MNSGQREYLFSKNHYFNWFLLAFLAGSVNVGGFMACHRFVTHLTGFATLFGADAAQGKWLEAFSMISVPLFFIAGAMVSALLIDRRLHRGQTPRYAVAMSLVLVCLLLAGLGGYLGWFGHFGAELTVRGDYFFLALLCMASGLQNAVVTSYSGNVVRTTHLTGITTDLGIGLIRVLFPTPDEGKQTKEKRFNLIRLGTILSFVSGSAIGAMLYARFAYLGFLLPVGLALYAVFAAVYVWQTPIPIKLELGTMIKTKADVET